jgi:dipeptidyl aminopeptidase/acylaminoacyl peptidase
MKRLSPLNSTLVPVFLLLFAASQYAQNEAIARFNPPKQYYLALGDSLAFGSPDGQCIVYSQINPKTNVDLYLLSLSGEKKSTSWLQTSFIEAQPRLSPNGRWIAYLSNETGQFQVYVDSFPVPGAKVAISIGGGSQPQWRADGRELYYYAPDQKLVAVEGNGDGPTFKVGEARPLLR